MREQIALQMNNVERGLVREIMIKGYFIFMSFLVGYTVWTNVLKPDLKEMCTLVVEAILKLGIK